MNCHCGKVALYIVNGKGKCAEHKADEKPIAPEHWLAWKRRSAGLCVDCGMPCGKTMRCELHARMDATRQREQYHRHKQPKA